MMDSTSAAILTLLHCSAAIKLPVAGRLAFRGIAREYPILAGSLVASALIQGGLLYGYWTGGWRAYGQIWAATTPYSFAVSMALMLEALSAMSRHFPKARNLAMLLIAIFGLLSIGAVVPLGKTLDDTLWLLWVRAHWKIAATVVLLCTRAFLGWVEPAMRDNVRRYVFGLLACMIGSAVGDITIAATRPNYWGIAAGQFTLLLAPMFGYRQWWRMDAGGEAYTPTKRPTLEELDGEMARIEEEIRARGKSAGA